MFFFISKVIGVLVQPLNMLILLALIALLLVYLGKTRIAKFLTGSILGTFFLFGYTQFPDYALSILERQTKTPDLAKLDQNSIGIIILGGTASRDRHVKRDWYHLNSSAERLTEAVILGKKLPNALMIFSGGSGHLVGRDGEEALAFRIFYEEMDTIKNELLVESTSKNTWQNAVNTTEILKKHHINDWLLITSAFHMPRAQASFFKAGLNTHAWPTDYRAEVLAFPWLTANSTEQFSKLNILFHELVGLFVYKITGRI